jgi:uncharacterized protein (DUF2147 family)
MRLFLPLALAAALTIPETASAADPVGAAQASPLGATFPADSLLGEWWTEGKEGRMKIVKTKTGHFEVILLDGKDANKKDVNNPNEKLRDRKLRGLVIMWHLRFEDGEYVDGYCYNPRDGNVYRVKMKVESATTLKLRGYLAVPLLGQTQEWTRAQ